MFKEVKMHKKLANLVDMVTIDSKGNLISNKDLFLKDIRKEYKESGMVILGSEDGVVLHVMLNKKNDSFDVAKVADCIGGEVAKFFGNVQLLDPRRYSSDLVKLLELCKVV